MDTMDDLLLYASPEGQVGIDVDCQDLTVWLTQKRMAELFGVQVPAMPKRLRNSFDSGAWTAGSVVTEMERAAAAGKLHPRRLFSLDASIAVGYRVNSRFRMRQDRDWRSEFDGPIDQARRMDPPEDG